MVLGVVSGRTQVNAGIAAGTLSRLLVALTLVRPRRRLVRPGIRLLLGEGPRTYENDKNGYNTAHSYILPCPQNLCRTEEHRGRRIVGAKACFGNVTIDVR